MNRAVFFMKPRTGQDQTDDIRCTLVNTKSVPGKLLLQTFDHLLDGQRFGSRSGQAFLDRGLGDDAKLAVRQLQRMGSLARTRQPCLNFHQISLRVPVAKDVAATPGGQVAAQP